MDDVKLLPLQYLLHPPIDARREGDASHGASEGNVGDGTRDLDDLRGHVPHVIGAGSDDADVVTQSPKFLVQIENMFDHPSGVRIVIG
jgi:hypothetical protein